MAWSIGIGRSAQFRSDVAVGPGGGERWRGGRLGEWAGSHLVGQGDSGVGELPPGGGLKEYDVSRVS